MNDARHDPQTDGKPGAPRGYSVIDDWAIRTNRQTETYSLHSPANLHPLTDIDALRDALAYLTRRVEALEADGRTYRAALDAQGDALQLLMLRGKP